MLGSDSLGASLALLAKQEAMDVRENTASGNGRPSNQLVEVLVVRDGQMQVTRLDNARLLLLSSLASQIANLAGKVLQDGSCVDASTDGDSVGVSTHLKHAVHSAHGEDQTCPDVPSSPLLLQLLSS